MSLAIRLTLVRLISVGSLCAIVSATTHAESLEDAWQLALSGNFRIQAAQQEQRAADSQLASANAQRLPSLVIAADYLKLDDKPTFEADIGDPSPFIVSYFDDESAYYSASTILPLYTGGRITAGIDAAKAQQSATAANTSHTVSSIKISVAKAYIGVLRAESAVVLAESHVKSLASHQTDVENLLGQGLVARNNLLAARVALADAKQRQLKAGHQSELARADYNRLLNRRLDTAFVLEPLISQEFALPLAELSSRALSKRADIHTLQHRSAVLDENAKVARAVGKPQFGLSSTYLHHNNRLNTDEDVLAANLTMVWKVFDGGVSRHRSHQLQRQSAAVKAQRDELAGVIELQVRHAWLTREEARQRIELAADSLKQADDNLSSSKNRFRAGLITHTEVMDAEKLRVQAHSNHQNAIYDAAFASLQLKYVTGDL